jgi:predicted nucleic acid-binding protein
MNSKNNDQLAIFIDTNIALHYVRLDQIDWKRLTQKKKIEIVVCAVVLMELEKNKVENQSKKIRKRAGEYGSWLLARYDSPELNTDVSISFCANEPMIDFSLNGLDKQNFDDRLVAAVIEHQEKNPEQHILVLTADLGVTFKFKIRGIEVKNLPEEYRLPEELDEHEAENRELRGQLAKIANRLPKVKLSFSTHASFFEIENRPIPKRESIISDWMAKAIAKYPKSKSKAPGDKFSIPSTHQALVQLGQTLNGLSDSQQAAHDQRLESFYSEYRAYCQDLFDFHLRARARFKLDLILSNLDGSAPANSIDIFVRCNRSFIFLKERQLPDSPSAPRPPKKPTSIFDSGFGEIQTNFPHLQSMKDVLRENAPDRPRLEIVDGNAKFYVQQLKHKQSFDLFPIWLDFGNIDNIKNVTISYEIHAEEIVVPVIGELHLRSIAKS